MNKKKSFSLKKPEFVINAQEAYKRYKAKEEFWHNAEILATLLTICLLLIFAIRPTVVAISKLLAEIKNKEIILERMRSKVNKVVVAQEKFSQLQPKSYLIDQFYPLTPQLSWGTSQLIGLAFDNNLEFVSISLDKLDLLDPSQSKQRDFSGIPFSISLKGEYQQIKNFISSLNTLARWVDIGRYSVSAPKKEEEGEKKLTLMISGYLRFFSESKSSEIKKVKKGR